MAILAWERLWHAFDLFCMNLTIALGGFNEEKKIVKKDNNQKPSECKGVWSCQYC